MSVVLEEQNALAVQTNMKHRDVWLGTKIESGGHRVEDVSANSDAEGF